MGGRDRSGVRKVGRRGWVAAAAGEGLAASEEEALSEELIVGAGGVDGV